MSELPGATSLKNGVGVIDPKAETAEVLSGLLNRVAWVAIILGGLSTVASVSRIGTQGWHPNIIHDIISYLLVLGLLLFRKRFPVRVAAMGLLGIVVVNGLLSFATLGLASTAFVMLSACCTVAAVFFGLRPGLVLLTLSLAIFGFIGVLIHSGFYPPPVESAGEYLRKPQTWSLQITTFLLYTVSMIVAVSALHKRLSNSLVFLNQSMSELREREEKYRVLTEELTDAVFTQKLDGTLTYVSPAVEKMFGYTTEEAIKMDHRKFVAPESWPKVIEDMSTYVALAHEGSVSVPLMEYTYVRKDGSTFPGELKIRFMRENGTPVGMQGILRDISERKRAQEENRQLTERLRQAEKMEALGLLAGGIAHDFNNHLTGIMGCADLIKMNGADNTTLGYSRDIIAASRRASDLTSKLLAFARKGEMQRREVDIHRLVGEVTSILAHSIDRRISIRQRLEARLPVVTGDASQLESALLNLGINARDAVGESGEIEFSTRSVMLDEKESEDLGEVAAGDYVEVTVRDTGCGMTAETISRIFEPFFTTKAQGKGTGMGLPAVYGTVTSHGGSIDVRSVPGSGTTFRILLPLIEQALSYSRTETRAVKMRRSLRVLVVDDDPNVRRMSIRALEGMGHVVDSAMDGPGAVERFQSSPHEYDLVLLDMILPGMSGYGTFREIQKLNPDIAVLVSSGYSLDHDIQRTIEAGAKGFLRKPYRIAELSEAILQVTEIPAEMN